jgi:glucuronate isomerase
MIAKDDSFSVAVLPSWRPDKAFKIENEGFSEYMQALGNVTGINIVRFEDLLAALYLRLDHFNEHGCCTADHGIEILRYAQIPTLTKLDDILQLAIKQKPLTEDQIDQFTTAVLVWLGRQYTRLGWVMQLHLGALRDNNSRMLATIGPNTGYDSIADTSYAKELSSLLNAMDITDELPKTVLYCLNPRDNEMLATMAGNFQGGGIAGKIQFGSGWWFNDQKDGMERQLQQLSQLGLLSQFIGMLTDSRSILSFTRHEYFRRILCNMLGEWVEQGEVPNRDDLLVPMIKDICFYNAQRYFLGDK